MPGKFESLDDAYHFLEELGATPKLLLHIKLVGEAAEILVNKLIEMKVPFDVDFVRLGVAFHDTGKIIHYEELTASEGLHEAEGERILIKNGIDKKLARCCLTHGKWETMSCSLEEYLIALSDKLWKGKRVEKLENIVINKVSENLNQNFWEVYFELDSCFESIAAEGDSRLLRSQIY